MLHVYSVCSIKMDILAKTVDADVMQKFVGLQCDFQGCGKQIDGYVDELKAHYVSEHKILTSSKLSSQIQCSICGQQYWFFNGLKTHIEKKHPRRDIQPAQENEIDIVDPQDNEQVTNDAECGTAVTGLTNPHFYDCENICLEQTSGIISELITSLRCDVSLPESKLKTFIDHKWTDELLLDFDESDFIKMNIIEAGVQKQILKIIKKIKGDLGESSRQNLDESSSHPDLDESLDRSMNVSGGEASNPHKNMCRSILFRSSCNYIVKILDNEEIPDSDQLNAMNRALMGHFFAGNPYPTLNDKQELAKKYILAFPFLSQLRKNNTDPPESYFFYKNGGKERGLHTGIIQSHCHHLQTKIKPEDRKQKKRKPADNREEPSELVQPAREIASMRACNANIAEIQSGMESCHALFVFLTNKKGPNCLQNVLQAFPHVLSFQGIIIRQIFDRLHPEQSNARSIEQLLRAGILLDERSFSSFDDKLVRGALRILKQMPNRGISLKGQVGADPDVVFAQPLIQWIHTDATKSNNEWLDNHAEDESNQMPHIVCLAPTKQSGQFYVVFNSYSLSVGNHFPIAVEILFKMIVALNLKTPAPLKKMYDLIALQIFKTINSSESVAVTKLNKRLNELYEG